MDSFLFEYLSPDGLSEALRKFSGNFRGIRNVETKIDLFKTAWLEVVDEENQAGPTAQSFDKRLAIRLNKLIRNERRFVYYAEPWQLEKALHAAADLGLTQDTKTEDEPRIQSASEKTATKRKRAKARLLVRQEIRKLPPRQQQILILVKINGMRPCDVAKRLGVKSGAVRRALHAAMQKFKSATLNVGRRERQLYLM